VDIEASVLVDKPHGGEGNIVPGEIPAGRYATVTHRDHSMRANKPLFAGSRNTALSSIAMRPPPAYGTLAVTSSRSRTYDLSHERRSGGPA
jgi:DNA gyrase inhibitor GyrI